MSQKYIHNSFIIKYLSVSLIIILISGTVLFLFFLHEREIYTGLASFYGEKFQGRKTASGEIYDMYKLTAASLTLPLGTRVRVTNLENNRHVIVRINDRGPYKKGRIIDLSYNAAKKLNMLKKGVSRVRIKVLKK